MGEKELVEMVDLLVLFGVKFLASLIGTLRTVAIIKGGTGLKLTLVGLDAFVWAYLISMIGRSDGSVWYGLVIVLATVLAVYVSDKVLSRMLRSVYRLNIYLTEEHSSEMQSWLYSKGISCTVFEGRLLDKRRHLLNIHVNKEQKELIIQRLNEMGVENPNIDLVETKVFGKIRTRVGM